MSVGAVKPLKQVIDDGTNATLEEAQSYADAGDAQTLTDAKAYADSKASSSINSEEENPIIVMNLGALGSDDYIFTNNPIVSFKFTALNTSYADTIQSYNSYFGKISIYEENELVYDATAKYERIAPDDGTLPGLPYGYKLDEPVQFTAGKNYDIQVELSSNGFHVDTVSSFNENGTLYNPATNISVEYTDNNDVLQVISAKSIFSALRFQHSSVGFESGAVKMTGKEIFFNNKQVATEGHEHNKLLSPDTTKEVAYTDNDGNLNITGNIVQQGSAYETHAEQLYTEKDTVIMRDGAVSGLAEGILSGFKILKYDGVNNCFFAIDNSGIARIGDEGGELQALATREDAPIDGGIAQWDASELKFKTISFGTAAGTVAEGDHTHNYEPAFAKNSAFNKSFGTVAGTVAEGNHAHDSRYLRKDAETTYSPKYLNLSDLYATITFDEVISYDNRGAKRITCNDGGGNWNFHLNAYYSNGHKYGIGGDGAASIRFMAEGYDGSISLKVAPKSASAGSAITWTDHVFDINGATISGNLYAADFIQSSDRRLKKNIKPLKKGIDRLIPISFEWKNKNAKGVNYGFIAQDLVKEYPELVGIDKNGYMNIKQNSIIALLVKEVQELKREIKKSKKKLKKK